MGRVISHWCLDTCIFTRTEMNNYLFSIWNEKHSKTTNVMAFAYGKEKVIKHCILLCTHCWCHTAKVNCKTRDKRDGTNGTELRWTCKAIAALISPGRRMKRLWWLIQDGAVQAVSQGTVLQLGDWSLMRTSHHCKRWKYYEILYRVLNLNWLSRLNGLKSSRNKTWVWTGFVRLRTGFSGGLM